MASSGRHVDMSSSTLFYREIDVVPMLSREEEMELAVSQEEIRHRMLSALLSVSPARLRFTEPLRALARGRRVEREVVDPVHWSLRQGVLPEGRREELEELIPAVDASIDCATVRRLRPSWSWVEELGEETFASLDAFRELLDRADRIISGVGMGREELQEAAVRYASRLDTGAPERRAWEALPRLRGIERRLRLTELRTGVDSRTLFDAGRRYVEASSRHRELLEKLVEANLRLVVKWARRYCRTSALEEMDLVQEGCRGLLAAAMRYDYHRGYRFSTYAVWWVRRAILRALSQQSALIHLPSEAVDGRKRIAEAIQSWRESRGRVPTTAELSEELDIEPEQVRCLRDLMQDPVSFDLPMEDRDRVADYLEDRISPAERDAYEADVRKRIDSALENLTDRERTIISLRFGLYDGEPQTLEDVGRIFGVSRERIRQIESRSLDKLREYGVFFPADREDERG